MFVNSNRRKTKVTVGLIPNKQPPFSLYPQQGSSKKWRSTKRWLGRWKYRSGVIGHLDEVATETGAKRQLGQSNSRREHSCEDASLSVGTLAEGFGVLRTSGLTQRVRSKYFYSWLAPGVTSGTFAKKLFEFQKQRPHNCPCKDDAFKINSHRNTGVPPVPGSFFLKVQRLSTQAAVKYFAIKLRMLASPTLMQ